VTATALGELPTDTEATTVRLAVSITETLFDY
jgi:hypothetical protein